jgi:hypothetical protein
LQKVLLGFAEFGLAETELDAAAKLLLAGGIVLATIDRRCPSREPTRVSLPACALRNSGASPLVIFRRRWLSMVCAKPSTRSSRRV